MEDVLKVDIRYITRDGRVVTIVGKKSIKGLGISDSDARIFSLYEGSNGIIYRGDGVKLSGGNVSSFSSTMHDEDIAFEFVE